MQLLEVKNDIAKILYSPTEKQLLLSDFILLEDVNQSLICQITGIESSSNDNSNIATVKLSLSINKNSNLTTYNGYIPSKDANVIYINPQEIAQLIKSSKTNLYWGKLSAHNDVPIYIGLNFLRDKAYIRCDNVDNSQLLNANLIYNLQFNKKRTVVFDTEGCFRHIAPASVLTLGRNFKLPLNTQAFEFIATNDLTECSVESKAFIQGILLELEEYAQSLDSKFIPFSLFKKVIDEQAKFNSIPELLILRNKILRYEQFGIFAETEEQFQIFNDYLAKSTITTIDSSSIDEKYQKLLLKIITAQINKKCYLIFNVTDYNTDKQTIAQIYDNNNIRPVVTSSYDYKFSSFLKSHCKNSVLFAPIDKRTDDDGYGLFQNKLRQREFIVYGENTFYMPLILKLETIDKNIFEKLLNDETKEDVDKFVIRPTEKVKEETISSTIKFEDSTKKIPTIKPVNYVVTQGLLPDNTQENKQFGEILQEEKLLEEFTPEEEKEVLTLQDSAEEITTPSYIQTAEETGIKILADNITQELTLKDTEDTELDPIPFNIQQAYAEETGNIVPIADIEGQDLSPSPAAIQQAYEEETAVDISDNNDIKTEINDNISSPENPIPQITPIDIRFTAEEDTTSSEEIKTEDVNKEDTLVFSEETDNKISNVINDQEKLTFEEKPEDSNLTENEITFEEPDLSNVNLDFTAADTLDFTESSDINTSSDTTEENSTAQEETEPTEDLQIIDLSAHKEQEQIEPTEEIEFLDIQNIKNTTAVEETGTAIEQEENSQNTEDITNDDLDFLDEYEGVEAEPEEIPQEAESNPSILENYINDKEQDEQPVFDETSTEEVEDTIKFEDDSEDNTIEFVSANQINNEKEVKEPESLNILNKMAESDNTQEKIVINTEVTPVSFSSDIEEDKQKIEINISEMKDNMELASGIHQNSIPDEFAGLTDEDEAILDMQSEDLLIINDDENKIDINDIEIEPEEEVDTKDLIEDFIEPPEEIEQPKEIQNEIEENKVEQTEQKTTPSETQEETIPPENDNKNILTFSFVEDMMPPEEDITEQDNEEPIIQIQKQPDVVPNKEEEQFIKVVNTINQTPPIEQPSQQEKKQETVSDENDDDKLFSAFNINESVQVRKDKLPSDTTQKRRIEQPKTEKASEDVTRQDIPVYSAQNQAEKEINYAVGDWVFHPKYGKGQVESFAQYSNKILFCTILFDNFGRRTLDAKLTGLEKIK